MDLMLIRFEMEIRVIMNKDDQKILPDDKTDHNLNVVSLLLS